MAEESEEKKDSYAASTFELLSWAQLGQDVTVRDDQYEFLQLLDGIELCRQKGGRFRLIDSGNLDSSTLEWLAEVGADVYTSSTTRNNPQEWENLNSACQKGRALLGLFHRVREKEESENVLSLDAVFNLAGEGVYIYLVTKKEENDFPFLIKLARECRRGESFLVCYHHGSMDPQLIDLGESGAWIHLSDQIIQEEEDFLTLLDTVNSAQSAGAGVVFHMEKGLAFSKLRDLTRAGAFLVLKPGLMESRYPFKKLIHKARKKKLDHKAYYLYSNIFPGAI